MSDNPWKLLTPEDTEQALTILGRKRKPDLTIAPDGSPYLYRWEVIPRRKVGANIYMHLQVASDPERPLHDHPWDNVSVILSGAYTELLAERPGVLPPVSYSRVKGDVIYRTASMAHRLFLPKNVDYALTLFTTGPVIQDWGFWTEEGWVSEKELIVTLADGRSVFKGAIDE